MVSLWTLQQLSTERKVLPKAGCKCTERSHYERDFLGETDAITGEYHQRTRDPAENEQIHPGWRCLWTDKEWLRLPKILNNRKEECADRVAISGAGFQPQEAMDEAAKKKAGNTLFWEKSCITEKHKKFHSQTVRLLRVSFAMPWIIPKQFVHPLNATPKCLEAQKEDCCKTYVLQQSLYCTKKTTGSAGGSKKL